MSSNPLLIPFLVFFFQKFELFWEFSLLWEFYQICKICEFQVPRLLLGDWLQIDHWVVRK